MSREIPEVVRAAAGLAATVLDEARKLPETLPGLSVRVIGFAMQKAMWVQQQYSGLVARGDEVFTGIRGENEPGLATFDEDLPAAEAPAPSSFRGSAFDRASESPAEEDLLSGLPEDSLALPDESATEALEELALEELIDAEAEAASIAAAGAADETAGVRTPEGEVATVEATTTDAGAAPPETAAGGAADTAGTTAPLTAPVAGYDDWSIAQLRGHLRGYEEKTVEQLLAYEEATLGREPYLRMLRNRIERVQSPDA